MKTYLTIDLDYAFDNYEYGRKLEEFLIKIIKKKIPIKLYKEHHNILKDIKNTYNKFINVDFHEDIVNSTSCYGYKPTCGTWANFIKNRQNAIFEWRYPDHNLCVTNGNGMCDKYGHYNIREWKKYRTGKWKKITRKEGLDRINFKNIKEASIVISPNYLRSCDGITLVYEYIKNGRITYQKAALREIKKIMSDIGDI